MPHKSGPNKQQKTVKKPMLRDRTDTALFSRLSQNIRPGNGAGSFFQPRSPHGARTM